MRELTYVARSIRGLEWVVAAEISVRLGALILTVGHREVHFQAPLTNTVLLLGSADDVFIEVGRIDCVPHTREALAVLAAGTRSLPWGRAFRMLQTLRGARLPRSLEVVASFLGRRNYNRGEIEATVGRAVSEAREMPFVEHGRANYSPPGVSCRVHLRNQEALVLIRAGATPLHRRGYKQDSRPGTLHPPLAFAMAMLAGLQPGCVVADPCCGAGTVLVEAQRVEPEAAVIGSDIDVGAIAVAARNLARAGIGSELLVADAGRLPYRDGSLARVISNVPWGTAVQAVGILERQPHRLQLELARTLARSGRAVLLGTEEMPAPPGRTVLALPIRLFGRPSVLNVFRKDQDSTFDPLSTFGLALAETFASYHQDGNA